MRYLSLEISRERYRTGDIGPEMCLEVPQWNNPRMSEGSPAFDRLCGVPEWIDQLSAIAIETLYMSDILTSAQQRLTQIQSIMSSSRIEMTLPFDPDSTVFPSRKDVPRRDDAPEGAAWVWGKDDNVRIAIQIGHTIMY